jgi:hypothetical protein
MTLPAIVRSTIANAVQLRLLDYAATHDLLLSFEAYDCNEYEKWQVVDLAKDPKPPQSDHPRSCSSR